jgi:hypothetical protein
MKQPTPKQIAKARTDAGLTQAQAAEMIHAGAYQRWSEYERGLHEMPLATWELFLLKTGQQKLAKFNGAGK